MTRRAAIFGLALALGGLAAGPAHAGTASVEYGTVYSGRAYQSALVTVRYAAAPGERNNAELWIPDPRSESMTVVDTAGVTPGAGCARPLGADGTRVTCSLAPPPDPSLSGPFFGADVDLGDGDDVARVSSALTAPTDNATGELTAVPVSIDGGPGSDDVRSPSAAILSGGAGNDRLTATGEGTVFVGGPGEDLLAGGPAADWFAADSAADGADTIAGGAGPDVASYGSRRRGLSLSLDGRRNDGERSERDRIGTDVEELRGGRGADRLTGDRRANVLYGAGGADRITGGRGRDQLIGGSGPDRINARDRVRDRVDCGRGRDRATTDRVDVRLSCERGTR